MHTAIVSFRLSFHSKLCSETVQIILHVYGGNFIVYNCIEMNSISPSLGWLQLVYW